jgi:hypothetical protein
MSYLKALLSEWRIRVDDEAPPFLWSDVDGVRYLNEAENEACERAKLLEDDSVVSTPQLATVFTVTAGVATATLPAHGLYTGQVVSTFGADQAGYNIITPITVVDPDNISFLVDADTPSFTGTMSVVLAGSALCNIAGKANIGSYAIDQRIIEIRSCLWSTHFLTPISRETLNRPRREWSSVGSFASLATYFNYPAWDVDRDWSTLIGTPKYFIDPQEKYLTLVRIPQMDAPIHLSIYRRPLVPMSIAMYDTDDDGMLVDPTVLDNDIQQPEIALQHHVKLITWMEYLCYSRRDSDAQDDKKAQEKSDLFDSYFGIRPDANVRRMQRARRSNAVRMNPSW